MAVHDQFPQWLNFTPVTESSVGVFTQTETQLPVRISDRQVIECLGVQWRTEQPDLRSLGGASGDEIGQVFGQISKQTQVAIVGLEDADTIDQIVNENQSQYAETTETGGAGFDNVGVEFHDFASSGQGFLIAAQSLFLGVDSTNNASVRTNRARMLYRLVKVSAAELIGLVSQ